MPGVRHLPFAKGHATMRGIALKICTATLTFCVGLAVAVVWKGVSFGLPERENFPGGSVSRVSEIRLEHSCYLVCFDRQVVLRNDGTAERVISGGPDEGAYRGEVKAADYLRLAKFLEEGGFFSLDVNYIPVTS